MRFKLGDHFLYDDKYKGVILGVLNPEFENSNHADYLVSLEETSYFLRGRTVRDAYRFHETIEIEDIYDGPGRIQVSSRERRHLSWINDSINIKPLSTSIDYIKDLDDASIDT